MFLLLLLRRRVEVEVAIEAHPSRMSGALLLRGRAKVDSVHLEIFLLVRARTWRTVSFASSTGLAIDAVVRRGSLVLLLLNSITTFRRFELKVHCGRFYRAGEKAAKVLVVGATGGE